MLPPRHAKPASLSARLTAAVTALAVLATQLVLPPLAAATERAQTTIFIGQDYEVQSDGTTVEYIRAGTQLIAVIIQPPTGPQRIQYIHPDHLGSTNLVTNEAGHVIAVYSRHAHCFVVADRLLLRDAVAVARPPRGVSCRIALDRSC